MPIAQNIAISQKYDAQIVNHLLEKVGLEDFIERLPDGIETPLYKDFDENGYEISGGEAQKKSLWLGLFLKILLYWF